MKTSILAELFVCSAVSVFSLVYSLDSTAGELKLVLALFRHGDRSPIKPYQTDEYQTWPNGLGELTKLGKNNAFHLGKYFWNQYGTTLKLSSEYMKNPQELCIRSTAVHRTQMSAKYFLAGFYHPEIEDVNEAMDKLVEGYDVPHKPESEDQLFAIAGCPKQEKMLATWKAQSSEFQKFLTNNDKLMTIVSKMAGIPKKDIGFDSFKTIVDDVFCEVAHEMTQPDTIRNNMEPLMAWMNESSKFRSPTEEIQKLTAGPLIYTMVNAIHKKIVEDSKDKMMLFSAHDTNIIYLLSALGVFNNIQPPYSSVVILELRQVEKLYYIHTLYHNESNHEPYPLKLTGCDDKRCLYSAFTREMQKMMISPEDRGLSCPPIYKTPSLSLSDNVIPITIAVVLLVCLVLSFIMYRMYRRQRRPRSDPMMYRPLAYGEDDDEDV